MVCVAKVKCEIRREITSGLDVVSVSGTPCKNVKSTCVHGKFGQNICTYGPSVQCLCTALKTVDKVKSLQQVCCKICFVRSCCRDRNHIVADLKQDCTRARRTNRTLYFRKGLRMSYLPFQRFTGFDRFFFLDVTPKIKEGEIQGRQTF